LRSEEILVGLIDRVLDLSRGGGVEPRSAVDDRTVDQARQYLATNVSAHPTLDAVARAVGVDKYTLVRRFRRAGATTPHRYLVMLRLEQAREQLARGTTPAEAAQAAGFADQAHLTRWFRRYFGTTPAAYRRQVRSVHGLPSISFKIGPPPGPTVPGHEQARARPDQPGGGDTPSRTLRGPAGAAEPH
jgi:AraC-like DNA-binding protein